VGVLTRSGASSVSQRIHSQSLAFTSWVVTKRVGFVDDPSAGSPTETLLRLLLPLNDQV
jgi:hypothetical protein